MDLPDLLDTSRIACQADVRSKKRALELVASLLTESIDDEEASEMHILDALNTRERLGSTSLGHGVGLPHSRCAYVDQPIAALLTTKKGVDYDASDGQPVDLVVGLLVPEDCNDEHLEILASLARQFNDASFRSRLRTFEQPEELFSSIRGDESDVPGEPADKNGAIEDTNRGNKHNP
ncbi:MAG: PTS sugar transporter subunit IIA [Gammaproteobacteria bacterium]|nr:PTS sugar transporter subunit IIA [Gammaproteobacteria bacterium]